MTKIHYHSVETPIGFADGKVIRIEKTGLEPGRIERTQKGRCGQGENGSPITAGNNHDVELDSGATAHGNQDAPGALAVLAEARRVVINTLN